MSRTDTKRSITVERLVDETSTVYSLPLIYERLNDIINHPRCSIADIAQIITEDQGLTARLLKLANSPMFGYFSKIDSIDKAVTIIGTQQLRDMALAMSVMEIFSDIPRELISMESFWRHSLACGIVARALAVYRREANVERYFAAGILHDLGRFVMCVTIPDFVHETLLACREEEELLFSGELRSLGFTHAELGGALLSKWRIPMSIVEPVACHHSPSRAERYFAGAAMIHLADIICQALEFGSSGGRLVPPLDPTVWEYLNIPPAALPSILKRVEPQLVEAFAILGEHMS